MAHLATEPVERFDFPVINALNFVIRRALGGGGMASLRSDPLGKSFAQILLEMPVPMPAKLARRDGLRPVSRRRRQRPNQKLSASDETSGGLT